MSQIKPAQSVDDIRPQDLYELAGKRVLVLGLGLSGLAAVRFAVSREAQVTVIDTRDEPPHLPALRERYPAVGYQRSALSDINCTEYELIVWSPGISIEIGAGQQLYQDASEAGIPVVGELDIFTQALAIHTDAQVARLQAEAADRAAVFAAEQAAREAEEKAKADEDKARREAAAHELDDQNRLETQGLELADPQADPEANAGSVEPAPVADASAPAPESESSAEADSDVPTEKLVLPTAEIPRPKVIAVTGTNGKTTVCSLATTMANAVDVKTQAVGNIGATMLDAICDAIESDDWPQLWVLELSSFQLALSRSFDPDIAVILNVSADHLDWHRSVASYAAAKRAIAGPHTHLVLPAAGLPAGLSDLGDPMAGIDANASMTKTAARELARKVANAAPRNFFGTADPVNEGDTGLVRNGGVVWLAEAQASEVPVTGKKKTAPEPALVKRLMPVDVLRIRGEHNHLNALAALAVCRAAGLPMAGMLHAMRDYRGEPHRCQLIARIDDVNWYDDSKGTNVGATCAALDGLEEPMWLLAGGIGKDQDFAPLAEAVSRRARGVILFGQDAEKIRSALSQCGIELLHATDFADAMAQAAERSRPGEAVLLSPACASFDMFENYQARGDAFVRAVQAHGEDRGVIMELPC
ncbi:MAG: UDP-N-acetylmuramoyl-L-alanine--D-glutamate ligase [Burkholderiaceae bacterium]